jgi:hypothetical protein
MGPKGKILLIAGSGNSSEVFEAGTFEAYVWEPTTGALRPLPKVPEDMFCAGHMLMSNGRPSPREVLLATSGSSRRTSSRRAAGRLWVVCRN